jgi:Tfp pilus assembly pilus retraction ATPase PilT
VPQGSKRVEGDLKSFTIFDITQTLLAGRKTAAVQVAHGSRRGFLHFQDGQIVHASDDAANLGEAAAFAIFTWRDGSFSIDFDATAPGRNIDRSTDWLMLEVARNLDEARAESDAAPGLAAAQDVERVVGDKVENRLRHELNAAFKKIVDGAEPTRARYVRDAFDGTLKALLDRGGSALFLKPGAPPRVKTAEGVVALDDAPLSADELRGFLQNALSESERALLRERREVGSFYSADGLGVFSLTAIEDDGAPFVAFAPARRDVPDVASFGLGLEGEALQAANEGLVVVAGPLGSGKSVLAASLVKNHLENRDRFVAVFSSGAPFEHSATRGAVLRRRMPAPGEAFAEAMRGALELRPDVVVVDPVQDREALRVLLNVARTGRLVVAVMESLSPVETLGRLGELCADGGAGKTGAILAESLRAIVDLAARRADEPAAADVFIVGREEQSALATNDFAELRRRRIAPKAKSRAPAAT